MNIIRKKCIEADLLAARFYKSAAGDKRRVARDWEQKVKEAADLIELYTFDHQTSKNLYLTLNFFYIFVRHMCTI